MLRRHVTSVRMAGVQSHLPSIPVRVPLNGDHEAEEADMAVAMVKMLGVDSLFELFF